VNIQAIIESGTLEAYVLGALPAEEADEIALLVSKHPELQAEVEKIEQGLEALGFAGAIAPPEGFGAKFFATFDQTQKMAANPEPEPIRQATIRTLEPSVQANMAPWRLAVAASVAVALLCAGLAWNYYGKWQQAEGQLSSLMAQSERVAQNYEAVSRDLEQISRDLEIMGDITFTRLVLSGTQRAPQAATWVYWNPATADLYLQVKQLQQLSREQQFQLWAIIDGQPVDAGVFDATAQGLLKMKSIAGNAQAFAITIEPRGGSVNPSLETMQVYGALNPA
jgi:anti-sigma-K factor RskA